MSEIERIARRADRIRAHSCSAYRATRHRQPTTGYRKSYQEYRNSSIVVLPELARCRPVLRFGGWLPVCHSRASELLSISGTALRQAQSRLFPGRRLDRLESRSHYRNRGFRNPSHGSLGGVGFQPVDLTGWKPVPQKRVTNTERDWSKHLHCALQIQNARSCFRPDGEGIG
jgi:hypothetical protein